MRTINGHKVALQAHRGVSTDCPENTMAAFRASVEQGYDWIELDPKFTADNQCVVLHDRTINRTGRDRNGQPVEKKTAIIDLTLAQAREYEYGSWQDERFRGEQMPLLEEALLYAKEHNIPVKIDNVIETFTPEQTEILFGIVEKTGTADIAGFTCTKPEYLAGVVARFPDSVVHYDGPVDEEKIDTVCSLLRNNPLIVWLMYPNKLTSWCKTPPITKERVAMVRSKGARVGVWILECDEDLIDACERFKPDLVETTGKLKPDA